MRNLNYHQHHSSWNCNENLYKVLLLLSFEYGGYNEQASYMFRVSAFVFYSLMFFIAGLGLCIIFSCSYDAYIYTTSTERMFCDKEACKPLLWSTCRGRVTQICVNKQCCHYCRPFPLAWRQKIFYLHQSLSNICVHWQKSSEIWSEILRYSFYQMHLTINSAKYPPFCLGSNVLSVWLRPGIQFPISAKGFIYSYSNPD